MKYYEVIFSYFLHIFAATLLLPLGYLAQQAEKLLKRQLKQYDKPTRAALSVCLGLKVQKAEKRKQVLQHC